MDVLSTTVSYNGSPIKIEGGKVFARAFGTTIHRQNTPGWSWQEIPVDKMKNEFKEFLQNNDLI